MNMNKARPKGEETDNNGTEEAGALRGGAFQLGNQWENQNGRGLGVSGINVCLS